MGKWIRQRFFLIARKLIRSGRRFIFSLTNKTGLKKESMFMKEGLQTPRGYFEGVDYIDEKLTIRGWMLLPDEKIDSISVFINKEYVSETGILERQDVADAFFFITHARYSGFTVSLQRNTEEMNGLIDVCLIAKANGNKVAKMRTSYSTKLSINLPPAHLMKRQLNNENSSWFRASCFQSYRDLWEPVCKRRDPKSIRTLLDWGCGCGRLITTLLNLSGIPEVHGCDIDSEAIGWCKDNLSRARFTVNPPVPPTEYPDNFFDLVIGNSVFTHLTRDMQLAWLEEMRRVTAPGGLFLASVHGEFATYFSFPNSRVKNILGEGIYDGLRDANLDGIAPEGYYRATFQSQEYTKRVYGKYFEILEYVERGWSNYQDLVVMKKR